MGLLYCIVPKEYCHADYEAVTVRIYYIVTIGYKIERGVRP